jgi:hypothetical protein
MKKEKTKTTKEEKKDSEMIKNPITPKLAEGDDKYELEEAIRTLAKAEEIKQDSDLMSKIKPQLDKKVKSIDGLKKLYEDKYNKPSHAEEEE